MIKNLLESIWETCSQTNASYAQLRTLNPAALAAEETVTARFKTDTQTTHSKGKKYTIKQLTQTKDMYLNYRLKSPVQGKRFPKRNNGNST